MRLYSSFFVATVVWQIFQEIIFIECYWVKKNNVIIEKITIDNKQEANCAIMGWNPFLSEKKIIFLYATGFPIARDNL